MAGGSPSGTHAASTGQTSYTVFGRISRQAWNEVKWWARNRQSSIDTGISSRVEVCHTGKGTGDWKDIKIIDLCI